MKPAHLLALRALPLIAELTHANVRRRAVPLRQSYWPLVELDGGSDVSLADGGAVPQVLWRVPACSRGARLQIAG